MKKKLFVCAFLAICLSIVAYGTIAYFTAEETATNIITTGYIKIELQEWAVPEGGGDPVPFEDVINVLPGTDVSKIVQVKNISLQPAWIRISLDDIVIFANGKSEDVDSSLIYYDLNTESWTEKEGYYYYNSVLKAGETTEPLFTKVSFSETMGNTYQNSKFTVRVSAQATQVIHNGETVFEALGWPESQAE